MLVKLFTVPFAPLTRTLPALMLPVTPSIATLPALIVLFTPLIVTALVPVSYTHLDVYKRQPSIKRFTPVQEFQPVVHRLRFSASA